MSLTDLKRKKIKPKAKKVSVDDFIEDANNYAHGKPSKLAGSTSSKSGAGLDKKSTRLYRHATFTLTEVSISQLDSIARKTGIAKSRLLRIFIRDFHNLSEKAQTEMIARDEADETQ
ncbi:replication protein RepA [Shewanella carassii]|uniref:Replication protein RepA n=1 Tax=Shewanella carassii TaxID=1987584 RepID=A0ABQ1SZH7_9GAMM|nr:replication protein RepA [Shewanella carassii]BCV66132.1 replication protein RepA [Shewanella carassii]GGE69770.1 replication protein RepA [Shewanella carassii]